MYVYSLVHEQWLRKETETVYKLSNSQIIDIFRSKKAVYQFVENYISDEKEIWEMRLFPFETYTKKYQLEDFEIKHVLEIKQWEL